MPSGDTGLPEGGPLAPLFSIGIAGLERPRSAPTSRGIEGSLDLEAMKQSVRPCL
jgi:hypothetical protein